MNQHCAEMSKLQSVPGGGGERAPSAMSMDSASSYEAAHHDHDLHRLRTRLHHAIKETRKVRAPASLDLHEDCVWIVWRG